MVPRRDEVGASDELEGEVRFEADVDELLLSVYRDKESGLERNVLKMEEPEPDTEGR